MRSLGPEEQVGGGGGFPGVIATGKEHTAAVSSLEVYVNTRACVCVCVRERERESRGLGSKGLQ